jgi:glycosyltransferase involved in cell wall biosynthesis
MRFSIVIPAHNDAPFLGETLDSDRSQRRCADEVLLIDDASTDATRRVVESEPLSSRVRYLYNAVRSGFADAWNHPQDTRPDDFVTILHQDELLHPEYLAVVEQALRRFPATGKSLHARMYARTISRSVALRHGLRRALR